MSGSSAAVYERVPVYMNASKYSVRQIPRTTVFKRLVSSFLDSNLEEACHWAIEVHVSGWQEDFWDTCFLFCAAHVQANNPALPLFIVQRWQLYLNITRRALAHRRGEAPLTDETWRLLESAHRVNWVEAAGAITFSKKSELLQLPRAEVQTATQVVSEITATVQELGLMRALSPWLFETEELQSILSDPRSGRQTLQKYSNAIYLVSRICEHASRGQLGEALHLLSAAMEYETYLKKTTGASMQCMRRVGIPSYNAPHENSTTGEQPNAAQAKGGKKRASSSNGTALECDWIWIAWESFLSRAATDGRHSCLRKTLASLQYAFSLGYSSVSQRKTRLAMVTQALQLLTMNDTMLHWDDPIVAGKGATLMNLAKDNIGVMYSEIIQEVQQASGQPQQSEAPGQPADQRFQPVAGQKQSQQHEVRGQQQYTHHPLPPREPPHVFSWQGQQQLQEEQRPPTWAPARLHSTDNSNDTGMSSYHSQVRIAERNEEDMEEATVNPCWIQGPDRSASRKLAASNLTTYPSSREQPTVNPWLHGPSISASPKIAASNFTTYQSSRELPPTRPNDNDNDDTNNTLSLAYVLPPPKKGPLSSEEKLHIMWSIDQELYGISTI